MGLKFWAVWRPESQNSKSQATEDCFWLQTQKSWCIKGTVFFFFSGNSLGVTHSLKFWKSFFFFFRKIGKKKNKCFLFFPRNSLWATHSKIFETLYFYIGKSRLACFFFFRPFLAWFLFFFFSSEKFTFTHSLDWKTCFIFHSLTRISPKNPKKQTIPGKKKKTVPLILVKIEHSFFSPNIDFNLQGSFW